jgi:hypothetical protein
MARKPLAPRKGQTARKPLMKRFFNSVRRGSIKLKNPLLLLFLLLRDKTEASSAVGINVKKDITLADLTRSLERDTSQGLSIRNVLSIILDRPERIRGTGHSISFLLKNGRVAILYYEHSSARRRLVFHIQSRKPDMLFKSGRQVYI